MISLAWWLGQNAVVAAMMIPPAALACRFFRDRPAVCHLLWAVVLLKFLTPPIFVWPAPVSLTAALSPTQRPEAIAPSLAVFAVDAPPLNSAIADVPPARFEIAEVRPMSAPILVDQKPWIAGVGPIGDVGRTFVAVALGIWLIGGLVFAWLQWASIRRCSSLVRRAMPSPDALTAVVSGVAGELRVAPPPVVVSDEIASPFLWCLGRPRLIWPASLVGDEDVARARGVVAHELAHLLRRDHWFAWIECIAGAVWWWLPLLWFVRRRLREAAEMACDAIAVGASPDGRRDYAEMLLNLSSGVSSVVPASALAVRAGSLSSFERRLSMILSERSSARVSAAGLLSVLALALSATLGCSLRADEPAPVVEPLVGDFEKQFDDALKEIDKALDNLPAESKKFREDARKQMDLVRNRIQQMRQGLNPGIVQILPGNAAALPLPPNFNLAFAAEPGQGRLGAIVVPVDPLVANQLQLPANRGVAIAEVTPESAAAKAGLRKHDILLELGGKSVPADLMAFRKELAAIEAGQEIDAVVLRKGQKETIKGIKLPEAKNDVLIQPFGGAFVPFQPGIPVPPPNAPGFFPAFPPGGGPIQIQFGNVAVNGGESTSVVVANDDFTIKHSSGPLKVDIKGKREDGKLVPSEIAIEEGNSSVRAQAIGQVPQKYLPVVNRLLDGVK